jgi:hypothetical protein
MGLAASSIVAIATSLGSAGASFTQAGKQKGMADKAKAEGERAFEEAKKNLEVNFYEQLGIQKEAYELEREAMLSSGAQAIQAGVESERGGAATAGRVQLAQQQGQREIAGVMAKELAGLESLTAEEQSRLATQRAGLDLARAEGSQAAAAQAQAIQAGAISGGFQGLGSAAQSYLQGKELFKAEQGQKELDRLKKEYERAASDNLLGSKFKDPVTGQAVPFNVAVSRLSGYGTDLSKVSTMDDLRATDFLTDRAELLKSIRENAFIEGGAFRENVAPSGNPASRQNLNQLKNFQVQTFTPKFSPLDQVNYFSFNPFTVSGK